MSAGGPLSDVRVIEFGGIGPGPFAAMQLADMGADVVRIDRIDEVPVGPDPLRRGKRSIALDLRDLRGRAVALALVEGADVLIEGFRPGVIERLGLGPAACWERNPALVVGRLTGWGQQGPASHTAGHDISYIALTGALHAIGRAGQPPGVPLCLVGDLAGGSMFLVSGVLAALLEARRTGHGQVVDAAIVDGVASLMTPIYGMAAAGDWQDVRGVNSLDTGHPWYDVYETADSRWLAVGAIEDKFYAELVKLTAIDISGTDRADPGTWPLLRSRLTDVFKSRTRAEWEDVFDGSDACVSPVLSMREAPDHPHVSDRHVFVGDGGQRLPGPAPRFSQHPERTAAVAAKVGEHSLALLEELGISDVDELIADGVVAQLGT